MGILINEYYKNKEFKKRSRSRSADWQTRRTNVLLNFLKYAEYRGILRLKNIDESIYSAYINRLYRSGLKKTTIERYKKIIRQDLISHFTNNTKKLKRPIKSKPLLCL